MKLESLVGQTLDGKYQLESLLGKGGMGAVYLATHLGTERTVALKIIAPQFMKNDEFVERFKREARAAGRLRHPNVVDVTDFGFTESGSLGLAYLVMEYLDGCSLADVLAEERRLPLEWVTDILEQVCSAVAEAHRQGIVHRDLKPDNIWLEPNRLGSYRVKVLDFGIAKIAGSEDGEAANTRIEKSASHRDSGERKALTAAVGLSSGTMPESVDSEGQTLVRPAAELQEEAKTQILTAASAEPRGGVVAGSTEGHPRGGMVAGATSRVREGGNQAYTGMASAGVSSISGSTSSGRVTRVGSILGTPLYMSPEQCRGEDLTPASDIYSLGVITYQMLAGETPFSGDTSAVLKQQIHAAPPPVRQQNPKIPKKAARIIMAALSKQPSERPPSAEAFSGALKANAEGIGVLLRHSMALYSEHFPAFLRISFLAHLPVIILTALQFVEIWLSRSKMFSETFLLAISIFLSIDLFVANFLAASVISGITVPIVTQLYLAPLRPIQTGAAFRAFKKRLRPFLTTTLLVTAMSFIGFILLLIPGLIVFIRYALYAPVVMMEDLKNRAALKRAAELMKRSRKTVILIVLIEFMIPLLVSVIFGELVVGISKTAAQVKIASDESGRSAARLSGLVNIFLVPLLSIVTTLLYLKLRQAGGESLRETMDHFDNEETPRSKWQLRMRERLTAPAVIPRATVPAESHPEASPPIQS